MNHEVKVQPKIEVSNFDCFEKKIKDKKTSEKLVKKYKEIRYSYGQYISTILKKEKNKSKQKENETKALQNLTGLVHETILEHENKMGKTSKKNKDIIASRIHTLTKLFIQAKEQLDKKDKTRIDAFDEFNIKTLNTDT